MMCAMCGVCLGMYTPILRRRRSPLVLATRSGSRVVQITQSTDTSTVPDLLHPGWNTSVIIKLRYTYSMWLWLYTPPTGRSSFFDTFITHTCNGGALPMPSLIPHTYPACVSSTRHRQGSHMVVPRCPHSHALPCSRLSLSHIVSCVALMPLSLSCLPSHSSSPSASSSAIDGALGASGLPKAVSNSSS